jgi:hypothetical protein
LRQTVVAHAADRAKAHVDSANGANSDSDKATDPDFNESRNELMSIGYPIGWADLPQLQSGSTKRTCTPIECLGEVLTSDSDFGVLTIGAPMILGWLITALAITLGAPFWFDLLSKFMQVRATTKPQPADTSTQPPTTVALASKATI